MIRLIFSILIVIVILTLILIPFMKSIRYGIRKSGERIDRAFTEDVSKRPQEEIPKLNNTKEKK